MIAGRPREFDQDAALERAMALFWRQGYEATGMQQLVEETGVCRQSLYNTFGDKHSLFLRVIEHYRERVLRPVLASLTGEEAGLERIRRTLRQLVDRFCGETRPGCLMTQATVDLAGVDPAIQQHVAGWRRDLEKAFRDAVASAQAAGQIAGDRDPRVLASLLVTGVHGLVVMGRGGASKRRLHAVGEAMVRGLTEAE